MSEAWPAGVPETLWRYRNLRPNETPQIPMMGVEFGQQFLIAFVVGLLFLGYFARVRFNTRSNDAKSPYQVVTKIEIGDLGGSGAIRNAYIIYLITLLILYVSMTFFGKLIIQTLNDLRIVGIQVDATSLQFESPQWPLMLAFGFAGLAPLIPPLRTAETWLFNRAYRGVGIPVRIHETTRNLVSLLNTASEGRLNGAKSLHRYLDDRKRQINIGINHNWKREGLARTKIENGLNVLAQLELLIAWANGARGNWPGPEVSDTVRDLEQSIVREAEELLDMFQKRTSEETAQGERRAERRESFVAETIKKARGLRDELVAIMAVYVERDPSCLEASAGRNVAVRGRLESSDDDEQVVRFRPDPSDTQDEIVRDTRLRELLDRADQPNLAGTGPELGVFICILFMVPIYAVFTWKGLHPTLATLASADSLRVIAATAGLSALLLVSVLWLPLFVAFAVRQHYYDERRWVARLSDDPSTYAEQHLAVVGMAFVVSAIALSGVGVLWAFFIARDVIGFQTLVVGGRAPFLLYYLSYALVAIPLTWLTLIAFGRKLEGRSAFGYGLLSGSLAILCLVSHLAFWYGGRACTQYSLFFTDLFASGCFRYYGGLNFVAIPMLAFLAALVFGNPRPASLAIRLSRLTRPRTEQVAGIVLATMMIAAAAPVAMAQEPAGSPASAETKDAPATTEITVGFRGDVEPFSYGAEDEPFEGGSIEQPRRYRGFIADLCYWIFQGSGYSVVEVPVTTSNRFSKLKDGKIKVLCDPVTMRFARRTNPARLAIPEDDRATAGTFSPIVFATGISYLERRDRISGNPVYVGYVKGTTAEDVLDHLCKVDLFGYFPYEERSEIAIACHAASIANNANLLKSDNLSVLADLGDMFNWSYFEWNQPITYRSRIEKAVFFDINDCLKKETVSCLPAVSVPKISELAPAACGRYSEKNIPRLCMSLGHDSNYKFDYVFEQLDNQNKYLLDQVVYIAKKEKESAESRGRDVRGPKADEYKNSVKIWSDIIDRIGACKQAPSECSPGWALEKLGSSCESTIPARPDKAGKGGDEGNNSGLWRRTPYRFCAFDTYGSLTAWFCAAENKDKGMVYLGDREIILGKLQTWNEVQRERCVVGNEDGAADLTYEPYAIMVARPGKGSSPEEVEKLQKIERLVQRRVYEFFSFSALAQEKFDTYFLGPKRNRRMSTALAYLFLLNGVEQERTMAPGRAEAARDTSPQSQSAPKDSLHNN
jgi:ABC-type amino acid transport substrate-binding protein